MSLLEYMIPHERFYRLNNAFGESGPASLRSLITRGEGQPNPIKTVVEQARQMSSQDYTTSILVLNRQEGPQNGTPQARNLFTWPLLRPGRVRVLV